ncbi:MAG TPA: N-acetylmuramoyl-L-alanine amidase, partial [Gemmatimonadales bacterium]|nr:N-acetylmuramoyl-L-alanine amidase [Gemmatimonadales bacterium]
GFATVRIVVSGAELSLHAPDGRVEVGSGELVRPVPAVPNGVAERIVAVQLHPASFWSGKQVMWQFQDQAGVRGALPAGRSRLEAVPGADFTPATRQSVVAADGTARVRIAMPSVAFNRGQLTVSAVDSNLVGATVPLEVPGIVAIDPGHGGGFQIFRRIGGQCREDSSSNNATGIATGTLEKDLTLDLAFRVREALGRSPRLLRVFLSRDTDVNLPLSDRARFARFKGADIMLCIHFNAAEQNGAPDPGPHGPVVFIRRANSNVNLAEDRALADRISARLRALRPSNRADHVVEAGFAVLNDPDLGNNQGHHPSRAVLLETDFLTNQAADQFFGNANNRSTIANAIAEALMEDLALQP